VRMGFPAGRFLREVGIDAKTSPEVFVDAVKVERSLARMAEEQGDPTFGITIARAAAVRPFGVFGHLLWLSGTLREVLERATRFYTLVTSRGVWRFEAHPGAATAALIRHDEGQPSAGNIMTEFAFASFVVHARAGLEGAFAIRSMQFAHTVADPGPFERFFETPVMFGAPNDALVVEATHLDLRNRGADPLTSAIIESHITSAGDRGTALSAFVDRVRRATAAELASGRPSLQSVSRRMGVSERSLRRQLADESVGFRELVVSVQREKAAELLARGHSKKEVAFALGFSEPSAFSRAQKRWTSEEK
jgi:AraC-like DNA-binding protein